MSLSNYQQIKLIGQGSFGEVWLMQSVKDTHQYVMKKILQTDERQRKSAETEVNVLCSLNHPNIVLYKECFTVNDSVYLIMEYCAGGDMADKISKQNGVSFSEQQILDWTTDICCALQYIHDKNFIHRDLKPQNIFLTLRGDVKIGDFGISRQLNAGALATTAVGTPLYVSPQIVAEEPYDSKTDVWSLGCCVYEMMTFKPAIDPKKLIVHGMREVGQMPKNYSQQLKTLTQRMLTVDPKKRPSVQEILDSPLIKQTLLLRQRDQTVASTDVDTGTAVASTVRHPRRRHLYTDTLTDTSLRDTLVAGPYTYDSAYHSAQHSMDLRSPGVTLLTDNLAIEDYLWKYLEKHHGQQLAGICGNQASYKYLRSVTPHEVLIESTNSQSIVDISEKFAAFCQQIASTITDKTLSFPTGFQPNALGARLAKCAEDNGTVYYVDNQQHHVVGPPEKVAAAEKAILELTVDNDGRQATAARPSSKPATPGPVDTTTANPTPQTYRMKTQAGISVEIYTGNVVDEKVEVLVSPVNSELRPTGGATKAISDAAGAKLLTECQAYIEQHKTLSVSSVMHTGAGQLALPVRYVIHAAGPRAAQYTDKEQLKQAVFNTFYNCIQYANDVLKAKSVSMPAVSSGTFAVSKQVVAEAARDALMKFDTELLSPDHQRHLDTVHFVDINTEATTAFINAFRQI